MVPRLEISPCRRARNFCRVGPILAEGQQLGDVRLGRVEECGELDEVHAVVAVVVARVAAYPAYAVAGRPLARRAPLRCIAISARHRRADEALQPPARWCRWSRYASPLIGMWTSRTSPGRIPYQRFADSLRSPGSMRGHPVSHRVR